jgi:CHASE2 domain-containing sensor protein
MRKFLLDWNHYCVVAFVFGFMWLTSQIPIQSDFIDPIGQAIGDFELTDMVFSKMQDTTELTDTNVVLINVGTLNRKELAQALRTINACHPKTVGIDLFFRKPKSQELDTALANALAETRNLVLVSEHLNPNDDGITYDSLGKSNPVFTANAQTGYANLITDGTHRDVTYKTCRTFSPTETVAGRQEVAFAVRLMQFYKPEAADVLLGRRNREEIINYKRGWKKYFQILNSYDMVTGQVDSSLMKNKIVLLGILENAVNANNIEDMFFTPLNASFAGKSVPDMNGVVIHANIISMMLEKDFITQVPKWVSQVIAVIACFLNVLLFTYIMQKHGGWFDLSTKVIQLIETILLFVAVVMALYLFNIKIDLTLATIVVVLSGDLLEIYYNVFINLYEHRKEINIFKIKPKSISK